MYGAEPPTTVIAAVPLAAPLQVTSVFVIVEEIGAGSAIEKDAVDAALKQSNKDKAAKLLDETDWTQVADCPLLNKQAFIDYRAIVRAIALNPTIDAVFPELPTNQWS